MYLPWDVKFDPKCIDTGYYLGQWNVSTPEEIERKIEEMQRRPSEPLLLTREPLEKQFLTNNYESDMSFLLGLEGAYVLPRVKNAPVTFDRIIAYVRSHYAPGPIVDREHMQIWYPIAVANH